jgi:hypothetical protein
MTVAELIKKLELIKDKDIEVIVVNCDTDIEYSVIDIEEVEEIETGRLELNILI